MKRLFSMGVIVLLDIAVIACFWFLSGGALESAKMVLWQEHILEDNSFEAVLTGICGLIYLKIIWKLINR